MLSTTARRIGSVVVAVGILFAAAPAQAADAPYACGTGILRDIEIAVRIVPMAQLTYIRKDPKKRGHQDLHGYVTPGERQDKRYLVTVEIDDMTYTVESSGNAFWDFDPTRLVINDSIGACVDGKHLVLRRPDGKNYKAKIVRAVRRM